MRCARWILLLTLLPGPVLAFEANDLAGLAIQVDALPEPVRVDGATFRIQRAVGASAPELVERIRQRWQAQGSLVRESTAGTWRLLSRWRGQTSELLQWRIAEQGPEVVLSTYQPGSAGAPSRQSAFQLPANCAWGRTISGKAGQAAFEQSSAYCTGSPRSGWTGIVGQLKRSGWRVLSSTAVSVHADRRDHHAVLTLASRSGEAGFGLVWLDMSEPAGEGP